MRNIHRQCTHTRQIRSRVPPVNREKTKFGLKKVELVGHLDSATGTSFTPEKRLKVLDFPQPSKQEDILQFTGLANYFRHHMQNMTEMVKTLASTVQVAILIKTSTCALTDPKRTKRITAATEVITLTLIPCIAHVASLRATAPRHSQQ